MLKNVMENKIKKFSDLECWKEARILVKMIYRVTSSNPFVKDFGLRDQIQRASVSVMANIAEGFDNYSQQEFIRFLGIALRSCTEVQSHLYVALDIGYITTEVFNESYEQANKSSNFIKAFLRYLRNK